mmetsp:Transcript_40837/g.104495  ORF Transcript_40837/g.104495 Transcript_40837/m.104495 type:complete len:259 (-) Transcript_40837:103-879(-)|eukprot:jgi/Tetstr1/458771/TSEL_045155.t1
MNTTILGSSTSPTKHKTPLELVTRVVYLDRIRVKDFFRDFDPLRKGTVTRTQFLSALNMAGINRKVQEWVLETVADDYMISEGFPPVHKVDYKTFCADVDLAFTVPELERTPTKEVPKEPEHLLDKTRYEKCSKILEPWKEERVEEILVELREQARTQRILVKPTFDDASRDKNSPCLVGHVTWQQFKSCMETKCGFKLWESDMNLLVEKYTDDYYGDMVNYIAFAKQVDPDIEAIAPFDVPEDVTEGTLPAGATIEA